MKVLIIIMMALALCGALITFWDMIWCDFYEGIALKIGLSMMAISMVMGLALLGVIL